MIPNTLRIVNIVLTALIVVVAPVLDAQSPPVLSNLSARQRNGGIIDIWYQLTAHDPCLITADYSLDAGSTWTSVSSDDTATASDIGEGVAPGRRKLIVWNINSFFTNELAGMEISEILLRLRADDGNLVITLPGGVPLVLRRIPAGTFTMGSPGSEAGRDAAEGPQHTVGMSGFYMGKYEVTKEQWLSLIDPNFADFDCNDWFKINFADPGFFWGECDRPVEGGLLGQNAPLQLPTMSWDFITSSYLPALNLVAGQQGQGPFDLPSEAQWEYACRAGAIAAYNDPDRDSGAQGSDPDAALDPLGWYERNTTVSRIVGEKKPNAWGLYDMHGNVREWCRDGQRTYTTETVHDPEGSVAGDERVVRGGAWNSEPSQCRSAVRRSLPKNTSRGNIGFRIAGAGVPVIAEVIKPMVVVYNEEIDVDGDELPDGWELQIINADPDDAITSLADVAADDDYDNDGLGNLAEFVNGASPINWDTDGDGMDDGFEVMHQPHLSPVLDDGDDDPDADGLANIVEYRGHDTLVPKKDDDPEDGIAENVTTWDTLNPAAIDSDSDGLSDRFEFENFADGVLDPSKFDSDGVGENDANEDPDNDGLINIREETFATKPFDWDTDRDNIDDGFEVTHFPGLNPMVDDGDGDADKDGLNNLSEYNGHDTVGPKIDIVPAEGDGVAEDTASADTLDPTNPDSDGDGLGDRFEFDHFIAGVLDPSRANSNNAGVNDAGEDPDNDGLINSGEENAGTNPHHWDSDGDRMDDGFESLHAPNLDALADDAQGDVDSDGLANIIEYRGADKTAPKKDDTPTDGTAEDVATTVPLNPAAPDTDGDGLGDRFEFDYFKSGILDPTLPNTNGIGPTDAHEDPDNDGVVNAGEESAGTHPHDWDTDNDGMDDGFEISHVPHLNPLANDAQGDADADGLRNIVEYRGIDLVGPRKDDDPEDGIAEVAATTDTLNPAAADSDGDGLPDKLEYDNFVAGALDPAKFDSDNDNRSDAEEDLDNDGLTNLKEAGIGTKVKNWDSDGDGMDDGYESRHRLDPLNLAGDDSILDPDGDTVNNIDEYRGDDLLPHLVDPNGDGIAEQNRPDDSLNPNSKDTDRDKMHDGFELSVVGLKARDSSDATGDIDGDGVNNVTEFLIGARVDDWDTDKDGIDDGREVRSSLKPLINDAGLDRDGDTIPNIDEYRGLDGHPPLIDDPDHAGRAKVNPSDAAGGDGFNPNSNDTDADDIPDNVELNTPGLSPIDDSDAEGDLDRDGVMNVDEYLNEPPLIMTNFDSDGDGMDDGFELLHGLDPAIDDRDGDPDGDGLTNLEEYLGTDGHPPLIDDGAGTTTAKINTADRGDATNPVRPTARFRQGWNLISTSWESGDGIDNQLDRNMILAVWTWIDGRLTRVSPDSEENDELTPGRGYWVFSTMPHPFDIPGKDVVIRQIPLTPGWNLIGSSKPARIIDFGSAATVVWSWDGKLMQAVGNELERFRGYWIYAEQDTVIRLSLD